QNYRHTSDPGSSTYEFQCDPAIRTASFRVSSGNNSATLTFDIDRVWWQLHNDRVQDRDSDEQNWRADPISVKSKAFAPMSDAELLVRLPGRDAKMNALVGFRPEMRHRLTSRSPLGVTRIALHEFSDASELKLLGNPRIESLGRLYDKRSG